MTYLKEKVISLIDGTAPVVAVLGNRYYSLRAPQGTITPYCIISMPTHSIVGHLKGMTKLERATIRFDLYGPSYPQLTALKESILSMMDQATTFDSTYGPGSEMYEDDTRFYHLTFDFSVWNYRD